MCLKAGQSLEETYVSCDSPGSVMVTRLVTGDLQQFRAHPICCSLVTLVMASRLLSPQPPMSVVSLMDIIGMLRWEPRDQHSAFLQWGRELRWLLRNADLPVSLPCDCLVCGYEVTATDLWRADIVAPPQPRPDVFEDPF